MKCPKCGTVYNGNYCPKGCNSPYVKKKGNTVLFFVGLPFGLLGIVGIVDCLSNVFRGDFENIEAILPFVAFLLLGAFLIFLWVRLDILPEIKSKKAPTSPAPATETAAPESPTYEERFIKVPEFIGDFKRKYYYDDVGICFCPESFGENLGYVMTLEQEPENESDPAAVRVMYNGERMGYLHKGKLQDMANDYISAGKPIFCAARKTDDEDPQKGYVFLAFYDYTAYQKALAEERDFKTYRLTGGLSAEAQDDALFMEPGKQFYVEYNSTSDRWEVDLHWALPKSAHYQEGQEVFLHDIEYDANGKARLIVAIF